MLEVTVLIFYFNVFIKLNFMTYIHIYRQEGRQAGRQAGRQTDRQTDR